MKKNVQIILLLTLTIFISCQNNTNKQEIAALVKEEAKTPTPKKSEVKVFDDFIYDVGPRFRAIKKSEIMNAESIVDFLSTEEISKIDELETVNVVLVVDDKQTKVSQTGTSKELTAAQIRLLQSFNYDTNFALRVDFKEKNPDTEMLENNYAHPHMTIVPEKQATFLDGKEALKSYLKYETEEVRTNVDPEKLKPAKLYFTVSKEGTIENVYLDRPSGYPKVDEKMIELIKNVPGTWLPAENTKGEKVPQELVVSFGLIGC